MTQCQIVLEVTVADCSTQLVQRRKTLVVRTLAFAGTHLADPGGMAG